MGKSEIIEALKREHPTASRISKDANGLWDVTYDWEFTEETYTYKAGKKRLALVGVIEVDV
jgi:hypothetical protein